jgi:hypothetical protein
VANKRVYYAIYSASISRCGENVFTAVHGLQSVGITTRFNLEQVFEVGQVSIYENLENIPDVECTMEKVLDGYPPIYTLATKGSASASLQGRSNQRATIGLSIYSDEQSSASGTAISQCVMSGVYVQALTYTVQVQGNATEAVTFVGNNKIWNQSYTSPAFNNNDFPAAIAGGSGGVNRREDLLIAEVANTSRFPQDIPGVTASGTVSTNADGSFSTSLQRIQVQTNLGRENLFELGRRGPFHRYAQFPTEVRTDIEVLDKEGDKISALEDAASNVTERSIYLAMREGLKLDLGSKNTLSNVTWGGANAGQNGGNATVTYTYVNFNDLSVRHHADPSGL